MTLLDASEVDRELKKVIAVVSRDKNLDRAVIIDALEQAIIHAARRNLGVDADLEAHYNEEVDEVELFQFRKVVDDVANDETEIDQEDALKLDPECVLGDSLGVKIDTTKFGRIAAQSAKQIIVQKVRDAERAQIFEEFKDRVGEMLSGHVRRFERNDIIIDLGRTEAVIPVKEQVPAERYKIKDRIQAYVLEVKRSSRGPQIVMSRAHTGFLIKLFEQVVTEIYDGIVSIEAAARDPGSRSKIAVYSRDSAVDPVGACVGLKGARVQAVVQELNGEKIDIIPFDRDPARLVCNALQPAVVSKVIVDEKNHSMEVVVADDQLSLAIGKKGQNVRLAAQLTGWKLDIKSESKLLELAQTFKDVLATIPGIGELRAGILVNEGIKTFEDVTKAGVRNLSRLLNLEAHEAEAVIQAATELASKNPSAVTERSKTKQIERNDETTEEDLFSHSSSDPAKEKPSPQEILKNDRVSIFLKLRGVGEATAHALADAGYGTIGDIIADSAEEVSQKTGLPLGVARTVQIAAEKHFQTNSEAR